MAFDSIINSNEFFSSHYLESLLQSGLKAQRDDWTAKEDHGEKTARSGIRSLGAEYFKLRPGAEADPSTLPQLHDAVLSALSFKSQRSERTFVRAASVLQVPVCATVETATGLELIGIEAEFSLDADSVVSMDEDGSKLLARAWEGDSENPKYTTSHPADLASQLFACDEPPRYVLILAGGIIVLADRSKWGEGKYLAVSIDDALGRKDMKSKGELETIAGLFSADVLISEGGAESTLEKLVSDSHRHAVGVSEDLRDGIRESIELLANEVISQRQVAKLGVYNGVVDPRDLTQQCLRYLYRLVFLLFAETRSELGVLPVDYPEYAEGYGLDRLRDLALVELQSEAAIQGTHIQESLELLFELINEGYNSEGSQGSLTAETESQISLTFQPLKSDLFAPSSTPLLNVRLSNGVLQQVLALLMLSRERRGRIREFVSYANLGINQLGAVYEGLMAYSGFFAEEDLFELAPGGDATKGSWPIPVAKSDEFDESVFVKRDIEGETVRVRHKKGSFVFRLSGRDRQRSASYYTPRVLTECVVRHALAELLDQQGQRTPARDILNLRICEPALGSGAFLNEAIDQLAAEYLRRRQEELVETLEPGRYARELQKVKAHLALHQTYGVDLNKTAVELAEVSLWLNAMHPGLQAPWFGLHLRRGNSLVGARRATYTKAEVEQGQWRKASPSDRPLAGGKLATDEIHHFLLPADGWGAVASAKPLKELAPTSYEEIRRWKKTHKSLSPGQVSRVLALARRTEVLWELAERRLRVADLELRRPVEVWGANDHVVSVLGSDSSIRAALDDPDSSLGRLRLAMDCWNALWHWPASSDVAPPTASDWLEFLEQLLGVDLDAGLEPQQLDLFGDVSALVELEVDLQRRIQMSSTRHLSERFEWLPELKRISSREGFFHWELEFAPVFAEGGFDLQVGNPPWVRPRWSDETVLAELDPWFGLSERPSRAAFSGRRESVLSDPALTASFLSELSSTIPLVKFVSSPANNPLMAGVQTNLYKLFMCAGWRHSTQSGIVAMLHPEGHLVDPNGGRLRAETYRRLRRHWQFANEAMLFEEVSHLQEFGIHVYGTPRDPKFLSSWHIHLPQTIDESLQHDGSGLPPGQKLESGGWDRRPHAARVIVVDEEVLVSWAKIFDEPGTPGLESRLLRPVVRAELEGLKSFASQERRLADVEYEWTRCIDEDVLKRTGLGEWRTEVPSTWDDVVLQGPHIAVALPLSKQPNEGCKNNLDYSSWDLAALPPSVIPRTNYQRAVSESVLQAELPHWNGKPFTRFAREVHRRMSTPGLARTLTSCLIPAGPLHVNTLISTRVLDDDRQTTLLSALLSSVPLDYLMKVSGTGDAYDSTIRRFPFPNAPGLEAPLLLRVLLLNCLTAEFAPLWSSVFETSWAQDSWTLTHAGPESLGGRTAEWDIATPLRTEQSRRAASIEQDVLVALALGIKIDALISMYRSQFAVLRKYENKMVFDAAGSRISEDHHAWGIHQVKGDWERLQEWISGSLRDEPLKYSPPFQAANREGEMREAYKEFQRRYADQLDAA